MADTLEIFGDEFTGVTGIKATNDNDETVTYYHLNNQNKTVAPSTSQQTVTADSGYTGLGTVTVSAMPTGTAGTPTATKGTVSNHSISVTPSVTNTTGYITGSTKTGTAVTVSASELVSGTYTVSASGTADVTNYASISVPALALPSGTNTSGVGTLKSAILPSTNQRYLNIPAGFNPTAQYYQILRTEMESLTVTENGTYTASDYDIWGFDSVTVNVSGGGSSMQTEMLENTSVSASALTFTGLKGEPVYFEIDMDGTIATGTPSKAAALVYDGNSLHGQTITNTTNAQVSYDNSSFSYTYNNGTLTVTASGATFATNVPYFLTYAWGGSAANVKTKEVQVGSGATSITFTGLEDEPLVWNCIFKSNFSTSSGYQRVITVGKVSDTIIAGIAMDTSAHAATYWTASYNNGSLTITSQGTNAGGYFHQPGYYQLTYVLGEASPYQQKTVTPTTSQQIVEPDTGYDALSKVTVTAIPSEYIIPTGNYAITANGNNINVAQYATVSVNVPSSGGANFGTVTTTNSSNQNTSISFTLPSGRTPKAFFVRLTSTIQRNSNSRYYYVFDMRWDGSSSGGVSGNCFYMYSGQLTDITSGYSKSQSGTTFTLSSTGSRSASPGSFYNGTYEMVYVY